VELVVPYEEAVEGVRSVPEAAPEEVDASLQGVVRRRDPLAFANRQPAAGR
jgi:hypothetical protein